MSVAILRTILTGVGYNPYRKFKASPSDYVLVAAALLADIIDAKEAEAIGLVNRIVPSSELDAFVDDWAQRLATGPPIALAMSKRLLNNSMNVTLEEALDDEGLSQTVNFSTADTAEAMRAFVEKRSPNFRGR